MPREAPIRLRQDTIMDRENELTADQRGPKAAPYEAASVSKNNPGLDGRTGSLDISIRAATAADVWFLWVLHNDPVARQMSIVREPATLDEHIGWVSRLVAPERSQGWIVDLGDDVRPRMSVGFVSIKPVDGEVLEVSVNVHERWRRMGVGRKALELICGRYPQKIFRAIIRHKNAASLRIFEQVGFRQTMTAGEFVTMEKAPHV
jgi:L-amino acid N-acyltransferase YncA